jgi:hypothetical protein
METSLRVQAILWVCRRLLCAEFSAVGERMTLFSGGAVLHSAIGVYGLMAFAVQQRTAKIGIRMALGADRNRVRGMVLRQGNPRSS